MISARIHNIARAEAETYAPTADRPGFDAVNLIPAGRNSFEAVTLFLPFGTGAAVAACINVAVSAGAHLEAAE